MSFLFYYYCNTIILWNCSSNSSVFIWTFLHHCAYAPLLMSIIKYYLFGEEFLTLGVDSHNELFTLVLKNMIIHCTNRFNQFCLGNWPIVSSKGSYKSAMMIYPSKHFLFHSICVNCTLKFYVILIWFLHQKFWLLNYNLFFIKDFSVRPDI